MTDNDQAQFDDAADALLRSIWPDITAIGAMVFGDTGALQVGAISGGTVHAAIFPAAEDVEFDEDGAELPPQVLVMSATEARVLATIFAHAADQADNVPGNVGWTEPCLEPDE
jgi:hypothetical protein